VADAVHAPQLGGDAGGAAGVLVEGGVAAGRIAQVEGGAGSPDEPEQEETSRVAVKTRGTARVQP